MMSIQSTWKRLITIRVPLSSHGPSTTIPLLGHTTFNAKSGIKLANFCTEITNPPTTLPNSRVVTEFLINKCGFTDEEIARAFRHCNGLLSKQSTHGLEENLELLTGYGLTTPAQIRMVVISNPQFLFNNCERNLKPKLRFFRTFMKEEDIAKFVCRSARIFNSREGRLKSGLSLLQRLGVESHALSELVATQPRLLAASEEKVIESFKQAEGFGFKMGTKSFANVLRAIFGARKENLDQRLQCLISLGFSGKQISDILMKRPTTLGLSEEKMKRSVDFLVKTVGLSLDDFVKNPFMFAYNLETRIRPRYRVMETLRSMQVQVSKREMSFPNIVNLKEERFLKKYVDSNAESSFLRDIYQRAKLES